jgi:IS5 family transposase
MVRRVIGQERLALAGVEPCGGTSLDEMAGVVDWSELDRLRAGLSAPAKGEAGWPPLCRFTALLLATWHELSDVTLTEALEDRALFRRISRLCRGRAWS